MFGLLKEWARCGKLKEVVGMNKGEEGSEGGKEIEVHAVRGLGKGLGCGKKKCVGRIEVR